MDISHLIFSFLTDVNKKLRAKVILVFTIVILFLTIDNILGFSYFYSTEKKITQVGQLTTLLKDTSLDVGLRSQLKTQLKEIVARQNIKDYFFSLVSKVSFTNSTNRQIANANKPNAIKNDFWMFFWTNIFVIIFMIVIPFFAFKDKSITFLKGLLIIFVVEIVCVIIAILQYLLLDLIPVLFATPTVNYLIAILYNIFWVILAVRQSKK
jgi:hypothetical protein